MNQGLQAWDQDGKIILDLTKRFAKILGTKTVTGNGQISVEDIGSPNNRLWYFVIHSSASEDENNLPVLRIVNDGKKIVWKNQVAPLTFYYGVY